MFAVNHAATALIVRRRYPVASLAATLAAVQAMELAWVALNLPFLSTTIDGPETMLGGRPELVVTVVLFGEMLLYGLLDAAGVACQ